MGDRAQRGGADFLHAGWRACATSQPLLRAGAGWQADQIKNKSRRSQSEAEGALPPAPLNPAWSRDFIVLSCFVDLAVALQQLSDHIIKNLPEERFKLSTHHCGVRANAQGVMLVAHGVKRGGVQSLGSVIAL